jgi:Putative transposase
MPQEWRASIRRQQPDRDDSVLRTAAHALLTLAAAPHDGGGRLGGLWVRHPWTRPLASPPHVHGLVPAGGVAADRPPWPPARRSSVGPVHVRSPRVRGVWRALVRQERPDRTSPASVWTKGWGVSGTPAIQGPAQVLHDWGREVHRIALPQSRRLASEEGHVCCRY